MGRRANSHLPQILLYKFASYGQRHEDFRFSIDLADNELRWIKPIDTRFPRSIDFKPSVAQLLDVATNHAIVHAVDRFR